MLIYLQFLFNGNRQIRSSYSNLSQAVTNSTNRSTEIWFLRTMIAFFVIVFRVDVNAFTMTYYKLYMQSKGHLAPILYCTS